MRVREVALGPLSCFHGRRKAEIELQRIARALISVPATFGSVNVSGLCLTQTGYFKPNLRSLIPRSDGVTGEGQGSMDGTERPIIPAQFPHSCVHLSVFRQSSGSDVSIELFWFGVLKPRWTVTHRDY